MRMIVLLFLVLSFAVIQTAYSQQQGEAGTTAKPEPKKADYPWYWNRPYENIDNFENSSLGKKRSSVTRGINTGSKQTESNVDINKQIDDKLEQEREKQQKYEIGYSSSIGLSVDPDSSVVGSQAVNEPETVKGTISNKKTITWVDENGVVHVTNDPTEVYKKSK